MRAFVLAGADLVLPDRVIQAGSLRVEGERIAGFDQDDRNAPAVCDRTGHVIVPGFVDAHVHGVEGIDTLDPGDPIGGIAARLPRYGVTAFSPTTVACSSASLARVLAQVVDARGAADGGSARVLPAHVEGPFLSIEQRGAQPMQWLRNARVALDAWETSSAISEHDGVDTLTIVDRFRSAVGVMTLAPEMDGAARLITWLLERGIRAALGHSSASFEDGLSAIDAGASYATHLFNCMPAFHHRRPGLAGAILHSERVVAEVIADAVHVHPALVKLAVAAKGTGRLMAVTDATSLAGAADGMAGRLGDQSIVVRDGAARLGDGRLAGSVATMDLVFRTLVESVGLSIVDAAMLCATTPSKVLGLEGGELVSGAPADFVVLDGELRVVETYVRGQIAYGRSVTSPRTKS
jgi:N-acetylglucosamine-6-phosphate deacetylase